MSEHKNIDPGGTLSREQQIANFSRIVESAVLTDHYKMFDLAYSEIATGLLTKKIPFPENLDDVVHAFEASSVAISSSLREKDSVTIKNALDVFRAVAFLSISAYGQGEYDGESPIAAPLYKICSELEENVGKTVE